MSVIIRGMNMPKGCASCPYCDRNWSKPKCHAKSNKGRYMVQKLLLDSRRQDWCPLGDVPKHGRLIDAGALTELVETEFRNWGEDYDASQFLEDIEDAPTIIEAEE